MTFKYYKLLCNFVWNKGRIWIVLAQQLFRVGRDGGGFFFPLLFCDISSKSSHADTPKKILKKFIYFCT